MGLDREPLASAASRLPAEAREAFARALGSRVRFDEPMARHTSFRIGGPADAFAAVETTEELARALALANERGLAVFVLGSGTNLLVSDRGVRGIVLHLGAGFAQAEWTIAGDVAEVRAGAAIPFKKLVVEAVGRGYAGLEFGEGIPGSLGGGLTMNAGAFGGEIGRVVVALEGVHGDGRRETLPREVLAFAYRRLDLPPGFVITAVRLRLERGDAEEMRARVESARGKRKKAQPLGLPNAGSVFKNPPGAFAGKLLEEAGLKGLAIGGAKVSERHANFIVNAGGASADDVRALMREMVARVEARSGHRLEAEIKLVGDW